MGYTSVVAQALGKLVTLDGPTWTAIKDKIAQEHSEAAGKPCQISHLVATDIVAVASLVLPLTKLSKANIATTIPIWDEDDYELNPFDLVVVHNQSELSSIQNEMGIGTNNVVVVPAIFLQYAYDKQTNFQILQGLQLTADVVWIAAGGGLAVAAIRSGGAALASYEAATVLATAVASGGTLAVDFGAIDPASSTGQAIGLYRTITDLMNITSLAKTQLPKLGGWLNRLSTIPTNFQIPKDIAQKFANNFKSALTSPSWRTLPKDAQQKLGAMYHYLTTKGIVAGEAVLEGLLKTSRLVSSFGSLKKTLGIALITGFSYVNPTVLAQNVGHITPQSLTSAVLSVSKNTVGLAVDYAKHGNPLLSSTLKEYKVIDNLIDVAIGTGSTAEIEAGLTLTTVIANTSITVSQAVQGAYQVLQLTYPKPTGGTETVVLARDQTNDPTNKCEVCATTRPNICKVMEALNSKAGGGIYMPIIENKLCANRALTDERLLEIVGGLLAFTSNQVRAFLKNINDENCTKEYLCGNIAQIATLQLQNWETVYEKHSTNATNARKYWNTLNRFGYLSSTVQDFVIKFSDKPGDDESSKGTLQEFSDDLESNNNNSNYENFNKFLNTHSLFAKGFVGYKTGVNVTKEQYDWMGEVLGQYYEETEPIRVKAEKWIDRSNNIAKTNKYLQEGKAFESQILSDLKDPNSAVYKKLIGDNWIPDLNQRQILSQVQFCINPNATSCTQKGEYFIADFVFVKKSKNALNQDIWDIVVADTKLSAGTDFTDNQNDAMGQGQFRIKVPKVNDINGMVIDFVSRGINPIPVVKTRPQFIKIYSNGSKRFGGITE